jgi:hypothetical protein
VPVEAARIQQVTQRGLNYKLTDVERGSPGPHRVEPALDGVATRPLHAGPVECPASLLEQDPVPARN